MSGFEREGERIASAAAAGLYRAGLEIMRDSLFLCPIDTGTLRSSARVEEPVETPVRISLTLGYGYGVQVNPKTGHIAAQYAVPVHERLDQHHAPPTQAKYLEQPVLSYAPRLGPTIAASIRIGETERDVRNTQVFE